MKLWTLTTLSTALLLILSGCGAKPSPSKDDRIDASLPVIELTKNGVFAETNAIAFEWKSFDDSRVKGIYVYKQDPTNKKEDARQLTYYSTIQNRFATHFVDENIKSNTQYKYMFKTFSEHAKSKSSRTFKATSAKAIDSVSWIHSIAGMPRAAKIIWRPHSNTKVKTYIIERKTLKEKDFEEIARVEGRLNVEFIDSDLKDNNVYSYRLRVLTYDDLISAPSKIVNVITKPLPKEVHNITATQKLAKKIELTWDKSSDEDFSHYNLYRSSYQDGNYELIAKLHKNNFSDVVKEDSKKYFYRVSAVDNDGLESKHDNYSIAGLTLTQPKSPVSVEATLFKDRIEVSWSNEDERIEYYIIKRVEKQGWLSSTTTHIKNIKSQRYFDKDIKSAATYYYSIYGVDKNSILSEASVEVGVTTPESTQKVQAKVKKAQNEVKVLEAEAIDVGAETVTPNNDLDLGGL